MAAPPSTTLGWAAGLGFSVSGKLADGNLVVLDQENESEWKQSTDNALGGDYEGGMLSILPATVTTYRASDDARPDGLVLDLEEAADGVMQTTVRDCDVVVLITSDGGPLAHGAE